jgi:putative ABC transport system permease protein
VSTVNLQGDVSPVGLAVSLILVAVAIGLSLWLGLGLEGQILWASLRALVQLLVVGVLLVFVLEPDRSLVWSVAWVIVMVFFAADTVGRRTKEVPHVRLLSLVAFTATGAVTMVVLFGLGIFPVEPRTLVPLAGLTIGNSMTATVLVANRIVAEFKDKRPLIEVRLALGFSARDSFRPYLREAVSTALIPQIETTKAVGIVFLPGAMTGLILAGVDPLDAVMVQIVVMYLVLGSVAVTTTIVALGLSRTLFTPDQRAEHLIGERPM